jgi:hypothetical protein
LKPVAGVSLPAFLRRKAKVKRTDSSEALLRAEKEKNFFLHVHVPKCAGVTFNSILRRNFGRAFVEDYGLLNNFKYSANQVLQMITTYRDLRCVASHRFSLDLPFDTEAAKVRAIVFVRDPVEWVASTYFYHRSLPNSQVPLAKERDFAGYVQERFVSAAPGSIGQTRFLVGTGAEEGLARIKGLAAKGSVLLFPVERFTEACVVLESLFPVYFRDCSFRRENVTKRDQSVMPDVREKLAPILATDFNLYEFAVEQHELRLRDAVPDRGALEQRLADFRQRCDKCKESGRGRR